jgi:DNA replication and checkpoint protein
MAQPVESPQSPSLTWGRVPKKIKGLSALISDFRANQQELIEPFDCEEWEDEDDLKIVLEDDSPGVAGRKPWAKKGAKRTKRRVISTNTRLRKLTVVRPVPQLEIPASDDEESESRLLNIQSQQTRPVCPRSPELPGDCGQDDGPVPDDEEPSDLDDLDGIKRLKEQTAPKVDRKPNKQTEKKAKGGYKIGKQVSGNFVSYKIRSKGRRGRGRFGRR